MDEKVKRVLERLHVYEYDINSLDADTSATLMLNILAGHVGGMFKPKYPSVIFVFKMNVHSKEDYNYVALHELGHLLNYKTMPGNLMWKFSGRHINDVCNEYSLEAKEVYKMMLHEEYRADMFALHAFSHLELPVSEHLLSSSFNLRYCSIDSETKSRLNEDALRSLDLIKL